jgi:hypothetical protein
VSYNLRDLKIKKGISSSAAKNSGDKVFDSSHLFVLDSWVGLFYLLENFGKRPEFQAMPILKTRAFSDHDLLSSWMEGPSMIRSANSTNSSRMPSSFEMKSMSAPLFLKDGDLYSFESRAKPYDIFFMEDHFIQQGLECDFKSYLATMQTDEWKQFFNHNSHNVIISRIERSQELNSWKVTAADGSQWVSPCLYWNMSLKSLLKHAPEMPFGLATRSAIQSLESTSAFMIGITLNKQVCDAAHTFIIPQSYTHSWGNFIVETASEFSTSRPWFKCLFYPKVEEINEDVVLQKIKLLKRSLTKLFPKLEACQWKEKYSLDLNYAITANEADVISQNDLEWLKQNQLLLLSGEFNQHGVAASNLAQFVENGLEACFENISFHS